MREQGSFPLRERFLLGCYILWLASVLVPRDRSRRLVKPCTILGHVLALKKISVLQGTAFFWDTAVVRQILEALKLRYINLHGTEALQPKRKEPISRAMVIKMLQVRSGVRVKDFRLDEHIVGGSGGGGGGGTGWHSWLGANARAAIGLLSASGVRLAEIALPANEPFSNIHQSRAFLFFVFGSVIVRCPTRTQLLAVKTGDQVGFIHGSAKNDFFAKHFGPHPTYINLNVDDPEDPGMTVIHLELTCPVLPSERRSTPLFTMNAAKKPMSQSFLRQLFKALLQIFLQSEECALYLWHSSRIGLACALRAAGASDAVIMAICRWRSPASLRGYARLNREHHGRIIQSSQEQVLTSVQGLNLPPAPGFLPCSSV